MITAHKESPKVGSGEIPKRRYIVSWEERRAFSTETYYKIVRAIGPQSVKSAYRCYRNVQVEEYDGPEEATATF